MTPYHHHLGTAGQTLKWFCTDSEENFQNNLRDPVRRSQLETDAWIDRDIVYSFNAHGFRCVEFEPGIGFVALGCSVTAGVGLPFDVIWPSIVGERLGIPAWNLGIPGGAMDTNFRMAEYWIPRLRPRFVVLLGTPLRIELVLDNVVDSLQLSREHKEDYYLLNYTLYDENDRINYRKNLRAISDICREQDVPFFAHSVDDWGSGPGDPTRGYDQARDLCHPGQSLHKHFANKVLAEVVDV